MKSVINKCHKKSKGIAEEKEIIARYKLCEICRETGCEAFENRDSTSKASIESHKKKQEVIYPAINQINLDKFLY
ncbi:MAG: hypothetical protein WDA24_05860 [Tissierellales bacterium]